ncbi:tetratricopeptide repeat protein [Stenomitos frigidus]|uniref:Tetratricopeptide repeat protein 38 n=1 Tax=Stenomitos frigidus ULC18 TaxID=2107698 RepID=A0A2T1ER78_9CYAN|nr:tetratricopeptide repeat protein [Stenomitos frigidus]PSB35244.1 tetratricopeptide repeat-containing protein [Stenomitos frigidus ULC18]
MLIDAQGLSITTDAPETVEAINEFTTQLLSYGKHADRIFNGVAADPASPLANAYAAALYLFAETADSLRLATPHLQAAQRYAAQATEREQWAIAAIASWAAGDVQQALAYHQALAENYPRDLVSASIGQYHHLFASGSTQGLLKLIETILPANAENHYVHGMLAFALEQNHQLEAAESAGRRAVAMQRSDPWAHHAIAHVLETQGRAQDGIAWLESVADTWEECSTFRCHNWWHLALYYLALNDIDKVLELYDRKVWGQAIHDYSHCQVNAIALLLRLELQGVDVGDRWQAIGPSLPSQMHNHFLPLTDLHLIYGLVRSGQSNQAEQMLRSIERHAANRHYALQSVWAEVVLPIARGFVAHAEGKWLAAITQMRPVLSQLQRVGGSHAQRQVFQHVYEHALVKS